ncbi:SOS response-associated peptidase family protein [Aestuariibacter salexigens]|uniref:SOS response-associated peptidase family protein n=1 Tax=Aestuariibacter salexigens TaxID=226010 RepID=UPI0003F5D3A9|nr:SOS response-associated peptidase family protein [Aestuariibacter salexigens]
MCGRLNVIDDAGVQGLCEQLGIELWPETGMVEQRFIRATQPVSIVRQKNGITRMDNAIWWLLLEATESGFKPSKYTSFNTRYDKLNVPRSAGFIPFRQSRCIIPAKGFGETEFINKKPLHYHDMIALEGEAIAFGGLYKEWVHKDTGEVTLSCSVITLPPHEKLQHIHTKAMPLMLPQHDETIAMWLDPTVTDSRVSEPLLQPHIPQDLYAQQIDKPSTYRPVGERFLIHHD